MTGNTLHLGFHFIVALQTKSETWPSQKGAAGRTVCHVAIKAVAIGNGIMHAFGSNLILVVTFQTKFGGIGRCQAKRLVCCRFIVTSRAVAIGNGGMA